MKRGGHTGWFSYSPELQRLVQTSAKFGSSKSLAYSCFRTCAFAFRLLSTRSPQVLEVHSLTSFGTLLKSERYLLITISKTVSPAPSLFIIYAASFFFVEHITTSY